MEARMKHPAMVVPDAMTALQAVGKAVHTAGVAAAHRPGAPAGQPDQRLQRVRRHARPRA